MCLFTACDYLCVCVHVCDSTCIELRTTCKVSPLLPSFGFWDWRWVVGLSGSCLYLLSQFAGSQCPHLGCDHMRTLEGSEQLAWSQNPRKGYSWDILMVVPESQVWTIPGPIDKFLDMFLLMLFGVNLLLLFLAHHLLSFFLSYKDIIFFWFSLISVHICKTPMNWHSQKSYFSTKNSPRLMGLTHQNLRDCKPGRLLAGVKLSGFIFSFITAVHFPPLSLT